MKGSVSTFIKLRIRPTLLKALVTALTALSLAAALKVGLNTFIGIVPREVKIHDSFTRNLTLFLRNPKPLISITAAVKQHNAALAGGNDIAVP